MTKLSEAAGLLMAAEAALEAGEEKLALDLTTKALKAAGISQLLERRAVAQAAEAINADPETTDINDLIVLEGKDGRRAAQQSLSAHLVDLPIGLAGTRIGAALLTHYRDELSGRAGWMRQADGVRGVPTHRLPEEIAVEVATLAGKMLHDGFDPGGDDPVDGKLPKTWGKPTRLKSVTAAFSVVISRHRHLNPAWMKQVNHSSVQTILRKIKEKDLANNLVRDAFYKEFNKL
jgi:hypothetical protein